ncbi:MULTISPECIES: metal-dependent hydrolase [Salinibaculum]|uniref:metal-dependent hydrolase n=1 Tax=Salinibaculum TaxID=2732368 RepID=UPI0030CC7608
MDLLTHLFLPVTVAYVLRPDLFRSPWYLTAGVVAIFPDVDKLLGVQGALHSVVTLGVIAFVFVALERHFRNEMVYAGLLSALLFSHLLLDFLDGGPVTVFYPFIETGVGLQYPTQLALDETLGVPSITQPVPELRVGTPSRSRSTYPLVTGYGVLSALTFGVIYLTQTLRSHRS